MRAVVTGGSGFIGSHVVDALVAAGHEVVVLDRAETVLPAAVDLVRADVQDAATLDRVLPGANVVLHLAAKVGLGVERQTCRTTLGQRHGYGDSPRSVCTEQA